MYALSSIVKAKFSLMFLKENQSPLLKAKQKQHTSAFVEEMTERKKWFSIELKNLLDIQQAMENSTINIKLVRKVK